MLSNMKDDHTYSADTDTDSSDDICSRDSDSDSDDDADPIDKELKNQNINWARVLYLLNNGSNPNACCERKSETCRSYDITTLLTLATRNKCRDVIAFLLEKNAHTHNIEECGASALLEVVRTQNMELFELFGDHATLINLMYDKKYFCSLLFASNAHQLLQDWSKDQKENKLTIIKILFDIYAVTGNTINFSQECLSHFDKCIDILHHSANKEVLEAKKYLVKSLGEMILTQQQDTEQERDIILQKQIMLDIYMMLCRQNNWQYNCMQFAHRLLDTNSPLQNIECDELRCKSHLIIQQCLAANKSMLAARQQPDDFSSMIKFSVENPHHKYNVCQRVSASDLEVIKEVAQSISREISTPSL